MNRRRLANALSLRGRGLRTLGLFGFCWLCSVAWAGPLTERILFVSALRGLPKIYLCRTDGRDLQRLSPSRGPQLEPFFSPARQRIFFVRETLRRGQILSVNLEGEDPQVHTEGRAEARHPCVSPDGSTLLYATDKWGSMELAEMDLASGQERRLTYDQGTNTFPRYSPDGESILFLSRRHGQAELYLWERATGGQRRLTTSPFDEGAGNWRPDGRRVIATRLVPPRLRTKLLELDLDSGRERILLPEVHPVQSPTYSSDGTQILFVRDQALFLFDPSDTAPAEFPLRGQLQPEFVQWIEIPPP